MNKALNIECVEVNQLESLVQNVQGIFLLFDHYVYLFKTRTAKHKKTSEVVVVFYDEFVQCCSMSFSKFSKWSCHHK